jgi:hypothetical protein
MIKLMQYSKALWRLDTIFCALLTEQTTICRHSSQAFIDTSAWPPAVLRNLPTHTHTHTSPSIWTYSRILISFQAHLLHCTIHSPSKHQLYNNWLHSTNTEGSLNIITGHKLEYKGDYINICVVIFVLYNTSLYYTQDICNKWLGSEHSSLHYLFLHFHTTLHFNKNSVSFRNNRFLLPPDDERVFKTCGKKK